MNKWKLLLLSPLLFLAVQSSAQTLTLTDAYASAEVQYPLIKQRELIRQSGQYSLQNIAKGALPQLTVSGFATYQSDVTSLPITLPGVDIPQLSQDQYRIYAEAVQPLTDLAVIREQKAVQTATNEITAGNLETELYKIRDRINGIYFGILLLDEQRVQTVLTRQDLQVGINKVQAAVENGTDYRSSLDKLRAELLKIDQRDIDQRAIRAAYVAMLRLFTGRPLTDTVRLEPPAVVVVAETIRRPELSVFESQGRLFNAQQRLLNARGLPKFSLFLQGGAGRPGLNFLDNTFKPYYIGGLRLNWSLSSLYTLQKERSIVGLNVQALLTQRETFLFNTALSSKQQTVELTRLQALLATDIEIIALRSSIKKAAQAQLDNGIITVNDYLREVLAEEAARQQAAIHRLQLLQASYNLNYLSGN